MYLVNADFPKRLAEKYAAVHEMEVKSDACRHVQEIVKVNHTYLNRIDTIETVFGWR